jgi:hypothetical protein
MRVSKRLVFVTALFVAAGSAMGHTLLLNPNGGEVLPVGSVFTVRWQVTGGNYNPLNWDLWYSQTGAGGPWTTLAMDLPAGSGANGSIHTYNWTVPSVVDDTMWVRVRMDNAGADYVDVSNAPFSIVTIPGDLDQDGIVGIADFLALLGAWGPCSDPCPPSCAADLDGDCDVGINDFLMLLGNWT